MTNISKLKKKSEKNESQRSNKEVILKIQSQVNNLVKFEILKIYPEVIVLKGNLDNKFYILYYYYIPKYEGMLDLSVAREVLALEAKILDEDSHGRYFQVSDFNNVREIQGGASLTFGNKHVKTYKKHLNLHRVHIFINPSNPISILGKLLSKIDMITNEDVKTPLEAIELCKKLSSEWKPNKQ